MCEGVCAHISVRLVLVDAGRKEAWKQVMGFRDGTEHWESHFEYECPAVGSTDVNYGLLQLAVLLPVAD